MARLFVAIELPSSVIDAAVAVGQTLRERIERTAPRARLTWVTADRMHVTVRFLGEVPDDRAKAITRALARPLATPAFPVALGAPGLFPTRGAPRTFWIALAGDAAGAPRLEAEVSSRLDDLGIPREARPFSPHLTLARVREGGGLRGAAVLAGVTVPPHAGGRVDAITLFESRLSSAGPTYTALQRTPLR